MRQIKLILGLGNPGPKYENTRHNLGFRILDVVANEFNASFIAEGRFKAETSAFDLNDTRVILARPTTFMNNSGEAVLLLKNFFKIEPKNILVIHDEIDLPLGTIRMSTGGSAGHRGVESIIQAIGPGFARLRIGIENRKDYRIPETETYVLQNFAPEEEKRLQDTIIPEAVEQIRKFLEYHP